MNQRRPMLSRSDWISLIVFLFGVGMIIIISPFAPDPNGGVGMVISILSFVLFYWVFPRAFLSLIWWIFVQIIRIFVQIITAIISIVLKILLNILYVPCQVVLYFGQSVKPRWLIVGIALTVAGFVFSAGYFDAFESAKLTFNYYRSINGSLEPTNSSLIANIRPIDTTWDSVLGFVRLLGAAISALIALPLVLVPFIENNLKDAIDNLANALHWLAIVLITLILVLCGGFSLNDALQRARTSITPPSNLASSLLPNQKLYFVFAEVFAPSYIQQGESQIVRLDVGITDYLKRDGVPIPLSYSDVYTLTPSIITTNFDLIPGASSSLESKRIQPNQIGTWSWIFAPKLAAVGRQAILWDIQIDDGLTWGQARPISISIEIQRKPPDPWQLPVWFFRPEFQVGAIIGGAIILLVGYLINPNKKLLQIRTVNLFAEEKRGNTAAIRNLIDAAFNDEELMVFCYDYFPAVYSSFSVGMSKDLKILYLIDFCVRHDKVEELLSRIRIHNPVQFDRYKNQIA